MSENQTYKIHSYKNEINELKNWLKQNIEKLDHAYVNSYESGKHEAYVHVLGYIEEMEV